MVLFWVTGGIGVLVNCFVLSNCQFSDQRFHGFIRHHAVFSGIKMLSGEESCIKAHCSIPEWLYFGAISFVSRIPHASFPVEIYLLMEDQCQL